MKRKSRILLLLVFGTILSSCQSKFDDAVSLIASIPVFFDDNRVDQNVEYKDGTLTISFPYHSQTEEWADNVIGDGWVPEVFIQKLFGTALSQVTLGKVLDSDTPVETFLSMMDEKSASFVIRYGRKNVDLSTDDVRRILNVDDNRNIAAPYFAKQLQKFAEDYNSVLQEKGLYIANARKEKNINGSDIIFININHKTRGDLKKINSIALKSLENYPAVPTYCHLNNLNLAFRYHKVNNDLELTSNSKFENIESNVAFEYLKDVIFWVPEENLSQMWKRMQEQSANNK